MALIAVDVEHPIRYVPESQRSLPVGEQAAFFIRPMTKRDMREFLTKFGPDGEVKVSPSEMLDWVERCVVGWENIIHPKTSQPIPFKKNDDGSSDPANLDIIPLNELMELFNSLLAVNQLGETVVKN